VVDVAVLRPEPSVMARAPFQAFVLPFRRTDSGVFEFAIFKRADCGYWQVVAGGGEDGETPFEAAKRECFEETGIPSSANFFALKSSCSISVENFAARHSWPKDLYVVQGHAFAVDAVGHDICLSHEHSEFAWVSYEEARKRVHWLTDEVSLYELNARLLSDDLGDEC